jgi:Ca2+-binding EF-hand superfamily protein
VCPRLLWSYREAEAKEELTYALIRSRFIFPASQKPGTTQLPTDFDFSAYLRNRMSHEVAHSLHVSEATWMTILLLLGFILYLPVLERDQLHVDVTVHYVIALGWGLWLYTFAIRAKLGHIMYMLTPPHALLDGPPRSFDEEAPTIGLLAARTDIPPYESLAPTKNGSKQERLFWRGRAGPGHLLFLLRFQMLATAICLAVLYTWLTKNPQDTYYLLLGFLPVLDVMITSPKSVLPAMVIVTSVEMLKKNGAITETLNEMKTEKMLKMLKMLNTLQASGRKAKKLQDLEKKKRPGAPPPKPKELDPATEAELTQAFELFDKDGSGTIDKDELSLVMQSLGVELDGTQLAALYVQMDPSGDGVIDFKEFCDVMADEKTTETPAQIASNIFLMLDADGNGKIYSKELKECVMKINPALTDDDVAAAMALFDADGSGMITEKEFRQGIEKMKTFG